MIALTNLAESVTPLKESLLGKTKDKVADIASKSASELAADIGFPREDQLNYATGGVVYYDWWYRPLIEENEKEIRSSSRHSNTHNSDGLSTHLSSTTTLPVYMCM